MFIHAAPPAPLFRSIAICPQASRLLHCKTHSNRHTAHRGFRNMISHISLRNRSRVSALLALVLLLVIIPAAKAAEAEKSVARINVTGTASVEVTPDLAILQLGVLREAPTARAALDANNRAMNEVVTSMKEAGIEARDLQTSNFSIQPRYVYHNPTKGEVQRPPKIVGYVVSNNLTVRLRDLTKIGDVLDRSVTLGVNNGGNVQFTDDDPKQEISTARAQAMDDALTHAQVLTKAAGVSLGPII